MIAKPTPNREEIEKAVNAIIIGRGPGRIVEVRAFDTPENTYSGYYNKALLIQDVFDLSSLETTPAVFWTIQDPKPALMKAGKENTLFPRVSETTKDADISRYLWLPIDCDPIRPPTVSSTDEEKAEAESVAYDVRRFLNDRGFAVILADSGNGYHVLLPIDIPNVNGISQLVSSVLKTLHARFGNAVVNIDTSVSNPSRVLKIYGSVARKGPHTDERPWRTAALVDVPANLKPLSENELKQLLADLSEGLSSEKLAETNSVSLDKARENASGERLLIPHGKMYGPLLKQAGHLWNQGFPPNEIPSLLVLWAHENCEPPINEAKVRSYARGSNWKRGEPSKEYVFCGSSENEKEAPANPCAPFIVTRGDDFMVENIPPRKVLLRTISKKEPVFFQQSINQIYAWRGVGKTNVALGLTSALATGGSFLNWEVPERVRVLYIEGEMPQSQLQERWRQIVGSADDYARLVTIDKQPSNMLPSLASAQGVAGVEATLTSLASDGFKVDVLILDSISTLFNVKANDEETWIFIQAWLMSLRSRGYCIFFLHHSGKLGLSRSHSKSEDMLDVSIKLESPKDRDLDCLHAVMIYDKDRAGLSEPSAEIKMLRTHSDLCVCKKADGRMIGCRGDGVAWEYQPVSDALLEKAFSMFKEGATLGDVAKELKKPRSTVQYWKNRWDEQKDVEPDVIL